MCTYLSAPCGSSGVQSGVALCADGPFFSALSGQRYYILLEDVRAGSKICCLLEPFLSLSKAQFTSSQSVAKMKFILAGALLASLISLGNAQLEEAELTVAGLGHSKPPKPYTCPKYCHFPPHSLPKCSLHLPCGFNCKDGYQPFPILFPTKCICPWPLKECNGKCGPFKACPSKAADHHKRDLLPSQINCPVGQTACGIIGRATGSWECIDTQRDLESCGGCLLSVKSEYNQNGGQDCTAIEGVADVSCDQGSCVVQKCMSGYEPDASGAYCVPAEREKSFFSVAKDILAVEFGA